MEEDSDVAMPAAPDRSSNEVSDNDHGLSARGRAVERESSLTSKRSRSQTPRTRSGSRRDLKRRRQAYRDEYRELLNEQINDVVQPYAEAEDVASVNIPASQIGMTFWTSLEKARLFIALERYGRHDLHGLALAISNKSILEVQQYLYLLQDGMRAQHEHYRQRTILRYAEVPAAFEVSKECDSKLEESSDALQTLQQGHEERVERNRFGRLWNLTQDLAADLEKHMSQTDAQSSSLNQNKHIEGSQEAGKKHDLAAEPGWQKLKPALETFDLSGWLVLSERVFMNTALPPQVDETTPRDIDNPQNWLDITGTVHQTPSIFATALTDFYNLAVSLTRRIAYTAHLQALSRCRATDIYSWREDREVAVTKRDVHTATDVLGLKRNGTHFWKTAARRNGLHIFNPKSRHHKPIQEHTKLGPMLSYREVERKMGLTIDAYLEEEQEVIEDKDDEQQDDAESVEDEIEVPDLPDMTREDELAALHEEEAEHLDEVASAKEEVRLMQEVLGQPVPEATQQALEEAIRLSHDGKQPPVQRKRPDELEDWRDTIDYSAPWEIDGYIFDFERARHDLDMAASQRRRPRVEHRVKQTEVEEEETSESSEVDESAGSDVADKEGSSDT